MLNPTVLAAPINEKTVELNFTVEIINYMSKLLRRPCVAWAPTLQQEANWGFDSAYGLNGRFAYIQYKRAKDESGGHFYELNRTKAQDQHAKLLQLESMGVLTCYLFPRFTSMAHLARHRRRLLKWQHSEFWLPSAIPVPNGGTGHHDFHRSGNSAWVTSERVDVEGIDPHGWPRRLFDQGTAIDSESRSHWGEVFSRVFGEDKISADRSEVATSATSGAAVIMMSK